LEKRKARVEIYEGDPFGSTCCGPGTLVTSMAAVEKLRKMLTQRSQIIQRLAKEYNTSAIVNREIISQERWNYPEYVRRLMFDGKPLPYVFIDEKPILIGRFPSYEELRALIEGHLRHELKQ